MKTMQLDAHGKGTLSYDGEQDILFFKVNGRPYKESLDFDDIWVDLDAQGFVTGIQIFGASAFLDLPKEALRAIQRFEFTARTADRTIFIRLRFAYLNGRAMGQKDLDFLREASAPLLSSEAVCTAAA